MNCCRSSGFAPGAVRLGQTGPSQEAWHEGEKCVPRRPDDHLGLPLDGSFFRLHDRARVCAHWPVTLAPSFHPSPAGAATAAWDRRRAGLQLQLLAARARARWLPSTVAAVDRAQKMSATGATPGARPVVRGWVRSASFRFAAGRVCSLMFAYWGGIWGTAGLPAPRPPGQNYQTNPNPDPVRPVVVKVSQT